jgi:hypothetical protein
MREGFIMSKRLVGRVAALTCVLTIAPLLAVQPLGSTAVFAAAPQFIVGTQTDLASGAGCTAGVATLWQHIEPAPCRPSDHEGRPRLNASTYTYLGSPRQTAAS